MAKTAESRDKTKFTLSNSAQMMLALLFGVITGLFFGEMVGWMSIIGNSVILLMQMTVFPYIVVSLVGGIGRLSKQNAGMLFREAGLIMVLLWLVGMLVILITPLMFPVVESASFFSSSSVEAPPPIDYFKMYIPANPFESMADGAVPAMVVFSIALGFALIGMKDKEPVLNFMSITAESLSRITQGLIKILPIGIFAMSASAAGTMGVEEFASLQVYLISYFLMCGVLAFWILPWIVASLTPVGYVDMLRISRAALVTAFATGNVFIILPVIIEECKGILKEKDSLDDEGANMIDILVPIAYSFPNIGKLTVILFVLFAGWFSGKPVDLASMPSLGISGLLALFGSVYVAIPFMLELVHLPGDLFQLFVMAGFITGKFGSMVAVMNLFALTLLSIAVFQKVLKREPQHWLRMALGSLAILLVVVVGGRLGMGLFIDQNANTSEIIANMKVADDVPKTVSRQFPVEGKTPVRAIADLHEIKKRGILRVGYRPSNVPFSYYNNAADLVGYDIAMAEELADDIGVSIEFVPFKRGKVAEALDKGYFDIAMSGLAVNVDNLQEMNFSYPVMTLNRSLVTVDHRVKELGDIESIRKLESLTIAYVEHEGLIADIKPLFPKVNFKAIANYKHFFKQKPGSYDALIISAEAGSAWTLFYPDYGVAILNRGAKYPVAYAVAWENTGLLRFVDNWVKLKSVEGIIDKHYNYWILGQGAVESEARWSIMKDVLQWVES